MEKLSRAHEEHLRELLQMSETPRDSIPYTPEFDRLKGEFWDRSFRKMTDAEFWRAIVGVAKQGGIQGKQSCADVPDLDEDQLKTLRGLLPARIGQRDGLPYTPEFTSIVRRFNAIAHLELTDRQVWLATLRMAK